jgi:hypothetical protein
MSEDRERKEKVVHTRIPESLDEELRKRASALGMSVSNLVRNALTHTFGLVEDIIADSAHVGRSARGEVEPAQGPTPAKVVAWQAAVLNLNAVCSTCNALLPKGTDAAIGIVAGEGPLPILCLECLEKVRHDRTHT